MLWFNMGLSPLSSAAALPLFASLLWSVLVLLVFLESPRRKTPMRAFRQAASHAISYVLPAPLPAMIIAIVAYCAALLLHVSFYIATPLFLWGSMCYLTRREFLKNILWTALCMGFIIGVFSMLFHVILP
jgi:hypothetical protein